MRRRTYQGLFGSTGILALALTVGWIAYVLGGLPAEAITQVGRDELRYVPADANIVAYVNVQDLRLSDFGQRLNAVEMDLGGLRQFQEQTGIDIKADIDQIVACLIPTSENTKPSGLVVLEGRFDTVRLEELTRENGGTIEDYLGTRLLKMETGFDEVTMAFMEPGVIAFGSDATVRRVLDLPSAGGDVTSNRRLMVLMSHIEGDSNAWAIGQLDDQTALTWLPDEIGSQVLRLTSFAISGLVNGGVKGSIRADARDEEAGQNLHNALQGFLALARMQSVFRPELHGVLDSFRASIDRSTVTLTFAVPAEILELLEPSRPDNSR